MLNVAFHHKLWSYLKVSPSAETNMLGVLQIVDNRSGQKGNEGFFGIRCSTC